MTDKPLRPYQEEAHEAVRKTWEEYPGAMLVMSTGSGKTRTALSIAVTDFLAHGKRVAWLARQKELLDQPMEALCEIWPEHAHRAGIVQAGRNAPDAQMLFASVQTLINPKRMAAVLAHGYPDLVVFDEVHLQPSRTGKAVVETLAEQGSNRLGLTATPDRADMVDLAEDWRLSFSYSFMDGIAEGYLVAPWAAVERLPELDLSRVTGRLDYDDHELAAELIRAGVVAHTVKMMDKTHRAHVLPLRDRSDFFTARGRSCLVYTASVDQAVQTAAALREAGWKATHVSAKTPAEERRNTVQAFRDGLIEVICNVGIYTTGTDMPRASCIVYARPTKSWALYCQIGGRGLRLYPGKTECFFLDLCGATALHSLVSAPILVGGSRCPSSPNGIHDFEPSKDVRDGAKCIHCERRVGCGVNLGLHTFGLDHHCSACGRPQCIDSDDGAHAWASAPDLKRRCLECGVEIPDPVAALVSDHRAESVKADWVRVDGLSPETYVVDVGKYGMLFVVGSRESGLWTLIQVVKGGKKPRPMTSKPVSHRMVRLLADDVVRRVQRVAARDAGWKKGKPTKRHAAAASDWYGVTPEENETAGSLARRVLQIRARERAIKTGIARGVL